MQLEKLRKILAANEFCQGGGKGGTYVRTACAAAMGTRRYLYHPKGHKGVGTWHAACGKRRLHVATKLTAKCEYVFVILGDSNQRRGDRGRRD